MKNGMKYTVCIAAAAMAFGGCVKTDEQSAIPSSAGKVAVSFAAQSEHIGVGSRAAIDEGYENGTFSGAWEATDRISVEATLDGTGEHLNFSYDPESRLFKGEMTEGVGRRTYRAVYPATDSFNSIPFGRERAQSGKSFNSAYDAMMSSLITVENAAAGKTDTGDGIAFGLQHLTAIIAAGFTSSDATAGGEKVKAIVLSADKAVSASTLTLDTETMTAALGSEGQSAHIAAIFDDAAASTAADARAFFNVPAGEYGALTLDIVTENHVATVEIDRSGKPLEAGKLYFLNRAVGEWTEITEPAAVWIGNEDFATMEIEDDMTGRCSLDIAVSAGIRKMNIAIDSPILTPELLGEFGLAAEMDLIDNPTYAETLGGMGLTTGDTLVNSRSVLFDVGSLVPLINMISGGMAATNNFTITLEDFSGRTLVRTMSFTCNSPKATGTIAYNIDADLWFYTATLTAMVENAGGGTVAVEYKSATETEWQTAAHVSGDTYKIAPKFADVAATDDRLAYKSHVAGTGVWLGSTYDIRLTVDGAVVATSTFDAGGTKDAIRDASMDNWSTHKVTGMLVAGNVQYPNTDDADLFWSNGNNKLTPNLCSQDNTTAGFNGVSCAKLKGGTAVGVFAAGNLFAGEMAVEGIGGALAKFGQKYSYSARPSAIKCRYKATITKMTHVGTKDTDSGHVKGETTDPARIMFCITDWNDRHVIKSGTSVDPTTFFNPETASSVAEGSVIGYGSLLITESTAAGVNGADENGWVELTLPVCWYDTAAKPNADNYSIVISAASSAYGDYLTGSTSNELCIEDFEWVY